MSRIFPLLLFLILVGSSCSQKAVDVEQKQLFDFDWKFSLSDDSAAKKAEFDDSAWRNLDLPHDWSIEGTTALENPMGGAGGYFPAGIGWYRKSFFVPASWKDKKVSMYFEGVYMNVEIFINGQSIGQHPYGYTSFYMDLSKHLRHGAENLIAVRVDNSKQQNCRWYSGSGIYRHVWLMVDNPVHIAQWGVQITTPEVSKKNSVVSAKTRVKNETDKLQKISIQTSILNPNHTKVGNAEIDIELPANSEKEVTQNIQVKQPALWSTDTPQLYEASIQVNQDGNAIDYTSKTFGIRSIEFSAEKGFLLNGNPVLLNGGCVHHDNGCLGAKAYDRAEFKKVELLKEAGFNAVRTAHNPPSEAFLDACDKLGLLVIDELLDGWKTQKTPHDYASIFDEWWQKDVESFVMRDRNHPSIIMWSIGNEIIERKSPEAVETAKMLSNAVHKLDSTRPVTSAMTSWNEGWEIFDPLMAAHDVCGYNYMLHKAESDHERVPYRVIVHTESYPKDAFYCWDMGQKHPYAIGDFVWTAMDYLGESGIGRYYYPGEPDGEHWVTDFYPWHGAYCGDIDLTGWRKPISHYRSMLYNDNEKLYMAVREPNPEAGKIKTTMWTVWPTWESWTWPNQEGKNIDVEVYSKYSSVRLYLNNTLIGEKPTTQKQEFKTTFTLPYTKGVLKAVGVDDNQEVESTTLKAADKAHQIKLSADRLNIMANVQDLTYITVEITDDQGILNPTANNQLNFSIEGEGQIIGVDNANLKDTDVYTSNTRKAWNGRAMVVIKSTKNKGLITLKVTSSGLLGGEIEIHTK